MKSTWTGKVQLAVKQAVTVVAEAVAGAGARPLHRCDGFHCDCERRREVAAQSRGRDGAWLPGRSGWLRRDRQED